MTDRRGCRCDDGHTETLIGVMSNTLARFPAGRIHCCLSLMSSAAAERGCRTARAWQAENALRARENTRQVDVTAGPRLAYRAFVFRYDVAWKLPGNCFAEDKVHMADFRAHSGLRLQAISGFVRALQANRPHDIAVTAYRCRRCHGFSAPSPRSPPAPNGARGSCSVCQR